MKKTNKYVIPILIFMILLLVGAYAIFNEVLFIGGTAGTTGEFEIQFLSATTTNIVGSNPTAVISADKKTLTIAVDDLSHPGAGAQIDVVVKNIGNIPAVLKTVDINGVDDPDIIVELIGVNVDTPLDANEEYSFSIKVYWDPESIVGDKDIVFSVELEYEQNTSTGY
ncbi:MAG: hypothetical protein PHY26_01745 [Bacilli bacterium]|nr:hypothetical protein [Bacilli bacterium]